MEKRILITGGAGFIGRPIVEKLLAENYLVEVVTTRSLISNEKNLHYHCLDLADKVAVAELVTTIQATHLLHLAWNVKEANFSSSSENFFWIDYSINLAQAFLNARGRNIVCAGTCFEYDFSNNLDVFTESFQIKPNTFYGECKNNLHEQLQLLSKEYQARLVWGRIFYPYGPTEEPRKLISSVIHALKSNQKFVCKTPNNIMDYIYVDDVADIFVRLLLGNMSGAFNICTGEGVSVRDIVTTIANLMNKQNLIRFEENDKPVKIVGSASKLLGLIGNTSRKNFAEGVRSYLI